MDVVEGGVEHDGSRQIAASHARQHGEAAPVFVRDRLLVAPHSQAPYHWQMARIRHKNAQPLPVAAA
jgi:hypothetical protein